MWVISSLFTTEHACSSVRTHSLGNTSSQFEQEAERNQNCFLLKARHKTVRVPLDSLTNDFTVVLQCCNHHASTVALDPKYP